MYEIYTTDGTFIAGEFASYEEADGYRLLLDLAGQGKQYRIVKA